MHHAITVLVSMLFFAASGVQAQSFTEDEESRIRELVREYILDDPEIIAEAITLLQARQETARVERQQQNLADLQDELRNPVENTVIGNPDGDITVVEFFDYNCGYCKSMFQTVADSMQENPDLRIVLIEFPILGPNSVTATKAALASRQQDLYGPFHQALMNHRGNLSESTIMTLARGVGLNIDQLKVDMKDPEIEEIIDKNRAMAQKLEISGTPAFVVGSNLIPGALPPDQFNRLIQEASETPG